MQETEAMPLRVSSDGHFLQHSDGMPFFYLADTAWMLFNKLTEEEARRLFANRAAKGFTVIQSVVFRDLFEPNTPNVSGARPFLDEADMRDGRMNPAWLQHVVRITSVAAEYGLVMGLLPTWGDKWNEHSNSAGPVVLDQDTGRRYCRSLSDALGCCRNVIWILGGDSPILKQEHADIVRAMAQGLRDGAGNERLVSFHPTGGGSSAIFHSESWLDFHALQSGHGRLNNPNYKEIKRLYRTSPPKPVIDMEPNYEWMPVGIGRQDGIPPARRAYFSAYDVRRSLYRSILAGAAGFSYGCEPIRQVFRVGDRPHAWDGAGIVAWEEALEAPGSSQLNGLKQAILDRDYFSRVPSQGSLTGLCGRHNDDPVTHISVARCRKGRYILVYLPVRRHLQLDTSSVRSSCLAVAIYDPATGGRIADWRMENTGKFDYVSPLERDTFAVIDGVVLTEGRQQVSPRQTPEPGLPGPSVTARIVPVSNPSRPGASRISPPHGMRFRGIP